MILKKYYNNNINMNTFTEIPKVEEETEYINYDFSGPNKTISVSSILTEKYKYIYPTTVKEQEGNVITERRTYPINLTEDMKEEYGDESYFILSAIKSYKKHKMFIPRNKFSVNDVINSLSIPQQIFNVLDKVNIEIGGQYIDTIHVEDFDRLYKFYNIKKGTNIIPLQFSKVGFPVPLYHEVKINFFFSENVKIFNCNFKVYENLINDPTDIIVIKYYEKFDHTRFKKFTVKNGMGDLGNVIS
jgi:hypothetical protein